MCQYFGRGGVGVACDYVLLQHTMSAVGIESLSEREKRKANTFSWPRGERPHVHDTETYHSSPRRHNPSISIEPDTSLELTEELFEKQEVESIDSLPSKAIGASNIAESSIIIYSDEESIDGDVILNQAVDEDTDLSKQIEPTDSVSCLSGY